MIRGSSPFSTTSAGWWNMRLRASNSMTRNSDLDCIWEYLLSYICVHQFAVILVDRLLDPPGRCTSVLSQKTRRQDALIEYPIDCGPITESRKESTSNVARVHGIEDSTTHINRAMFRSNTVERDRVPQSCKSTVPVVVSLGRTISKHSPNFYSPCIKLLKLGKRVSMTTVKHLQSGDRIEDTSKQEYKFDAQFNLNKLLHDLGPHSDES